MAFRPRSNRVAMPLLAPDCPDTVIGTVVEKYRPAACATANPEYTSGIGCGNTRPTRARRSASTSRRTAALYSIGSDV